MFKRVATVGLLLGLGVACFVLVRVRRQCDVRPGSAAPEPPAREQTGKEAGFRQGSIAGYWHPLRVGSASDALTQQQKRAIEALGALPYMDGTRDAPQIKGVIRHDAEKACVGYNLVTSGHAAEAILMDMAGTILHTWRFAYSEILPKQPHTTDLAQTFWRKVQLLEDGSLLAVFNSLGLVKLNADSSQAWYNPCRPHHDLTVAEDGTVYVLTHKLVQHKIFRSDRADGTILEDFVTVLSATGKTLREVSLLRCFLNSRYAASLYQVQLRKRCDIFHTNTIRILDGSLANRLPAFRRGNVLICVPYLNCVAVVDLAAERVVWALFNMWGGPHDPSVLKNGHILIFDNFDFNSCSKVVEFDPVSLETVWSYRGDPPESFVSITCSTAQRMPNGNTLVTETEAGRAFEVTPEKEIVWVFYNPYRAGKNNELIASLFEVERIPADFPRFW